MAKQPEQPSSAPQHPPRPLQAEVFAVTRLIEDFGALLVQETAALKKADFKSVDKLQPAKRSFAREYQAAAVRLNARKSEINVLGASEQEKLIAARTAFTVILGDNLRALEAAKDSTRRLIGRILDVARRSVVDGRQTNYSSGGRTQAYKSSTLSLAVDQKL
jgi:hypothetical protein